MTSNAAGPHAALSYIMQAPWHRHLGYERPATGCGPATYRCQQRCKQTDAMAVVAISNLLVVLIALDSGR